MVADDLDHAVEIEIGNDIALEQLQPRGNLVEPVLRPADQHFNLVRDPVLQHLLDAHHLGHPVLVEHVHVEREAVFQIGHPEQRVHQVLGINGAAFRFQHDPHLLVGLIANVSEDR